MATVFKVGSKCFCGGIFEDNTTTDGLPSGTYLKCNKCRRQALDPDLVQAYKKKQAKKGASK
jgi:hypothetical protein